MISGSVIAHSLPSLAHGKAVSLDGRLAPGATTKLS